MRRETQRLDSGGARKLAGPGTPAVATLAAVLMVSVGGPAAMAATPVDTAFTYQGFLS